MALEKAFEKYYSFFDNVYVNKVKNLQLAIKVLLLFVVILVAGFILLTIASLNAAADKNVHVEVNQHMVTDENYTVTKNKATPAFHLSVAKGLLYEGSSYTHKTIQDKLNYLLTQVHPDAHDKLYAKFKQEAEHAINNSVSQEFKIKEWKYPTNVDMVGQMTTTAVGYLTRKVGGTTIIDNKQYEYYVTTGIRNRIPYLVDYGMLDLSKKQIRSKYDKTDKK